MIRIANTLLDPAKITLVIQKDGDVNEVKVIFDNKESVTFRGAEAAEVWKALDGEKDWRDE